MEEKYKKIVGRYVNSLSEEDLYAGQELSRELIEKEISPEEVISIHKATLLELLPDVSDKLGHSFDFLIEMMIHYGLALQENQSLIRKQEELELEMTVAAKVQDTLLKTEVPNFPGIDIGLITLPAKVMSGDYVYFLSDDEKYASVAVADVIGNGIPAALCMSMIKFCLDNMKKDNASPQRVLEVVNGVVEENIDDSMFISMFYGKYEAEGAVFSYASAGHEPALLYKASRDEFVELDAKGLLLGIHPNVNYEERSVVLEEGDFIAMMTDGVTEVRTEDGFIEEDYIKDFLKSVKDEPAQSMVDAVYSRFGEIQKFQLQDDFSIVIFKKSQKKV